MEIVIAVIANQKRVVDQKVPPRVLADSEEGGRRKHEAARRDNPSLPGTRTYLGAVCSLGEDFAQM